MAEKALTSLAVRARSLEWATLHKTGDKRSPVTTRLAEIDPGENQKNILGGLQSDRDRLVIDIREKCGKLPAPVSTGIPASWALLRIAELPSGNPDELASMAELQVDKFSPFPVDESSISYELLAEHDGRSRLLLSAIRTETVDLLAEALREAGIQPKWVDINLLGWWQLLKDSGKVHQTGSQVLIILEEASCDMIVTTTGVPVSVRSLSGMEDLPPEEIDEEIARETVYTLAGLDLERDGSALTEISIWHKGEPPERLVKQFENHLTTVTHLYSLDSLPPLAEGLLRRAERRTRGMMDLAPLAWMEAENARITRRRMLFSTALVAGLWLMGMLVLLGGIQYQKKSLSSLETELTTLKEPADKVRAIRDRTQELIKYMDRSRSGLECLREICDRLPPGIELRQFNYRKSKTLEMTGEADAYSLVADFKKDLERSELFVSTELPRTQHTAGGKESFKIICTLPGGEKP
jgi:Tfp pilus assembly protein PilN